MQDVENKKKIVQTTIRFEFGLHERLNEFVHEMGKGKQPKDQPSKDSVVQEAVIHFIGHGGGENTAVPQSKVIFVGQSKPPVTNTTDKEHLISLLDGLKGSDQDALAILANVLRNRSDKSRQYAVGLLDAIVKIERELKVPAANKKGRA